MRTTFTKKQASVIKKGLIPVAAIAGLILLIAWMAGSFNERIEPGIEPQGQIDLANAIAVDVEQVETVEPVPASITARQTTIISSRVLARITDIFVNAGDRVDQQQPLVQLENNEYQAQVQQARAQVHALEARLVEAKSDLERSVQLRSTGVLSQSDLDRARANHDSLVAELDAAQQSLQQSETLLAYTRILSPIDGLVVDRFAEPGDTASPGIQILTLYNPTTLRVEAQVRETLALGLKQGQSLKAEIPSLNQTLNAVIEERVPAADPGSRSFLIKARLEENPDLQPGMYARLMIPSSTEKQLLIPADRVAQIGQMHLVWVASSTGSIERRFVKTGTDRQDGRIQITSGINADEQVLPIPEEPIVP
jgi:membrane fusion protein, multidrug efflux system